MTSSRSQLALKTILVTGGAGYVGSHACKALARAGYTPVCYDSLERGHDWAVKWGPLEEGNILERKRLDEVLKKYRPQAVMHFAAYAYVEESVQCPEKYFRNNVEGSITLIDAMRTHGIDKMIYSSSCAVYGVPQETFLTENHPIAPINPYGEGKARVEQILQERSDKRELQYVSLRYFNAAGADPDLETGECHDPKHTLYPWYCR
jgi:UDP-arabinose 4-epimerase